MKDATNTKSYFIKCGDNFNPRTHEGCDVNSMGLFNFNVISIHAPMKDATAILHDFPLIMGIFRVRSLSILIIKLDFSILLLFEGDFKVRTP